MHCRRYLPAPISRRQLLARSADGFGAVALAAMLAAEERADASVTPFAAHPPHFPARARNVIFLFMEGGVSHVDTFDPKPLLEKEHGQPFKMKTEPTQFNNNGNTLGSPWKFRRYGESGIPVSDLFPHVARCVDSLSIIRSMTSGFSEHASANYFLHTGTGQQGRPSMGSWAAYGLGSIGRNLPGFIVLNGGKMPVGGPDNFNSGFLPATYQGSIFRGGATAVANVAPLETRPQLQVDKLNLMRRLDADSSARVAADRQVESAIANYEMAFRMQSAVPEVMSLAGETEATRTLYGIGSANPMTRAYAESCLRARRLIEQGVRFVELTVPAYPGNPDAWDAHGELRKNHEANAMAVDQPIAALLTDLRSRGLLDETLVVWAGEFGRTPFAQGSDGRDHNPYGYTVWLAGGGAKPGNIYGATDEYGYKAVENKCEIYDLHATMLHLLGIDHKRLTYRWGGRDMRLTDVHGEVISGVVA